VNSRMFPDVAETWNPVTGCRFGCVYCWARRLAEGKLKRAVPHYAVHGFNPAFNERALARRFRPGSLVFACDMGDLWGPWVPREWILKVLEVVRRNPCTRFLFLTKNPRRYFEFIDRMPSNALLGATIETDLDEGYERVSRAPKPSERLRAVAELAWPAKVVSVEPVLRFSERFPRLLAEVEPLLVYVGYDNYGCRLPEPPPKETLRLVETLRSLGIEVVEKTLRPAWHENQQLLVARGRGRR